MRSEIHLLGAAFLCVLLCAGCGKAPAPLNVVIISLDTFRTDALGFTGGGVADVSPATPTIDGLLERGTYFSSAIAPLPRTTPALASLLTGLYPHVHGSREVGDPLLNGTLLSERLRLAGFATVAVSANDSAGPKQNLDRGFDAFVSGFDLKELYAGRLYRDREPVPSTGVGWAEATTTEALRLSADTDPDSPLFLWTLYFDPHFFYRPPSPWQDGVDAESCWQMMKRVETGGVSCGAILDDRFGEASAALEGCRRLYQAEANYVDSQVERLLEGLEQQGRLENTVFVFTADHGENLGEDGLFYEHGDNVHDAGLRVPLGFAGPGIAAGRLDLGTAGLIDVTPTILDLLGLDRQGFDGQDLDGVSLLPRLKESGTPADAKDRRALYAESGTGFCGDSQRLLANGRMEGRACIRDDRYTLCQVGTASVVALFDHVSDPGQTINLAGQSLDAEQALREAFERWPPETARQRTLRLPRFKLVQTPRLGGGYSSQLFDLLAEGEDQDVADLHPSVFENLTRTMEAFVATMDPLAPRELDEELIETLRRLGYIQ